DSLELPLQITNNSDHQIEINSVYNRESVFTIIETLPIIIPPFGSESIMVKFKPEIGIDYFDDLHLRWDTEGQRIAQVVPLIGSADPNSSSETENRIQNYYLSQNYPNPFNPTTKIRYEIPELSFITMKVFDVLGNEIATLVNEEKPAGKYEVEFNASTLPSGVYFYQLKAGKFIKTKKMVLLK
ncbi:MAG: T9SS type A sorting domain-containing protein, partial [Ignavibacteriaceae bacterium]|nr:T9SS type A sorting domain-containing protein [Ignavibacteriaceae bacterium]